MSDFNLGELDARDEATLAIKHPGTGEVTSWLWTFYGPGHPKTVENANKVGGEVLHKLALQNQARVNGKKWTETERTVDQLRADNVDSILARTKSFTPVNINGVETAYSEQSARELLLDRRKGWLFAQVMEFLADEASFMQPSAKA